MSQKVFFSVSCDWDSVLFSQEFPIIPESPSPLLRRNILSKVHNSVFMNMEPSLSLPLVEQNVILRYGLMENLWVVHKMLFL